jgi:hypothetical protein
VPLHIVVSKGASIKEYPPFLILTKLTTPPEFVLPESRSTSLANFSLTNSTQTSDINIPPSVKTQNISKQSYVTVNVQSETPFWEPTIEILNKFQFLISFTSGILTANILPWLYKKIKNKQHGKKENRRIK